MGWFVLLLIIIVCGGVAYLLWVSSNPDQGASNLGERPLSDEELLQARLDLHRVQRRLDVRLAKQEQRRAAERVKQAIDEALENKQ